MRTGVPWYSEYATAHGLGLTACEFPGFPYRTSVCCLLSVDKNLLVQEVVIRPTSCVVLIHNCGTHSILVSL